MLKKYLIKGFAGLAVFLALVWGDVFYLQRVHFMDAERYFSGSSWKLAIREYDAALHMYTPWSPYIRKSAERLWQIGEMFEKEDKPEWAVFAFASIRSSFFASRSLYNPGKDWIGKCNDKISDLNVKRLIKEGSISPEEGDAEKQKFLHVMEVQRTPPPGWALMMETGFFGWVASVIFIITKGFDEHGKLRSKFLAFGTLSFVLMFSLWIISLWKA